jgi:integrase
VTRKIAIFDETDQKALLGACEGDGEYVPVWLMMRCGMHPSDVSAAGTKIRWNGQFIEWKRAKNSEARREMVPADLVNRLEAWLRRGKKLTREGYNLLVHRVGASVGHPEYSPLTLRHTFGIQELRRFQSMAKPPPDPIGLTAKKMGCTRETVMEYYIDLEQWERLGE